ncbi:MAG: NAD(P)/FAD-dependent oxidoreductase, partial [Hyphomicrobiales bacterium]
IIIALGGTPITPEISGLKDIEFFTLDSILENQRKLTHLVIIGGDAGAFEQAQLQRRLGAQVTLVPQGTALSGFDAEATAILFTALADEGVQIRQGTTVTAIKPRSQGVGIEIKTDDGATESLDASHVLVSAGREVNFEEIDIAKANLKSGAATILRGPEGTTSSRSIRVVGTAAGQESWAEARAHGRAVVDAFLGAGQTNTSIRIPRIIETEPAIAQIGPLVEEAGRARPGDTILRENMAENDRAAVMGRDRGLVKVLVSAQGRIQRATVVGPQAGELAAALALAMGRKTGLSELAALPLPRPSLFEVLSRLGENYLAGKAVSSPKKGGRALQRLLRR